MAIVLVVPEDVLGISSVVFAIQIGLGAMYMAAGAGMKMMTSAGKALSTPVIVVPPATCVLCCTVYVFTSIIVLVIRAEGTSITCCHAISCRQEIIKLYHGLSVKINCKKLSYLTKIKNQYIC